MRPSRKTLLKFIPAGLGLLLSLGSCTVFAACGVKEDGSWMRCHGAQTTVHDLRRGPLGILALAGFHPGKGVENRTERHRHSRQRRHFPDPRKTDAYVYDAHDAMLYHLPALCADHGGADRLLLHCSDHSGNP